MKRILMLFCIATFLSAQENKPKYEHITEVRPDGTVVTYIICHDPEVKKKIDAQWDKRGVPPVHWW